ncbi:PIG-L family deacetylase [Candidatus Gottesmanbacteria bacterium]|nr:PIG-L family deacetylase [Candidatus Gottesmanbacteria bacterium]
MKKLLLSFAHPDDEAFMCGGTIAKYVQAGWEVHLLCATYGEAGGGGPYREVPEDLLGKIRQKELEESGTILGISAITFLGYKDGTLLGLHPGELEDKLYRPMASFAPDVVITFESNGISNHPDHSKICLSTTYAFQKYARDIAVVRGEIVERVSQRARRTLLEADTEEEKQAEPRLYYACMPESIARYLKKQKNIPSESFGKPWKGTTDKFITTVVDVRKFRNKKIEALQAHKSQQADIDRFLSLTHHPLLDKEYYILRMQGLYEVFMGKTDRVSNRL